MNIDFTTTEILDTVKREAMLPSSQLLYTDSDLLTMLWKEMLNDIVPLIMSVNEEYMVTNYDYTIVATQNEYAITPRAFGSKLRDAVLVNSNSRELSLPRAEPDIIKHQYNDVYPSYVYRRSFYFRDDKVIIFPDATTLTPFTLRLKVFRRPNKLVATSACGQVVSWSTSAKTVTVDNVPSTWTSANIFDFTNGTPPFQTKGDDAAITAVDATNKILTFSAALPTDIAVGDWIALSGQSPIAQIPYDVHGLLAQRVVVKLMQGMKDTAGLQMAADVYKDMVDKFKLMVTPRADGSPKRLVRGNALFGGGRRRNAWW